ncbi:MAG: HAMP domain-containing sensor histidine kinase [Chloroflexota bacterium]
MSIRLRLTLIYTAILGLTLVIFSTSIFFAQVRLTLLETEESLRKRGETAATFIQAPPPDFEPPRQFRSELRIQIKDVGGNIIDHPVNYLDENLPLTQEGINAANNQEEWFEMEILDDDTPFLVFTRQVVNQNGTPMLLQMAHSLQERAVFIESMRNALLIGSAVAVAIAFGVGWLLAGWTLKPINRITHTAKTIGNDRDFSRRVDHLGPNDEIGQLATTFNTMLNELEGAYVEKEKALQTQRRFAADASHELRTPLTTIRGNISLLQRDPPIDDEDKTEILEDMDDETERLVRLVNDLLTLARADAGRKLAQEPIPLKPLLQSLCQQFQTLTTSQVIICEDLSEVTVIGDSDALKQIFLILLDNASKHTPPNSKITLKSSVQSDCATVEISDNGPGIEADKLPRIFDRFYRGDKVRTGSGAGLGLAIAKELVEGQQAKITVESKPNQGSTFRVAMPSA